MALTRRDFIKLGGSTGLALTLAGTLEQESVQAAATTDGKFGLLIDVSKCIGCRSCESACKQKNKLPTETGGPRQLSARMFTFVDKRQMPQEDKQTKTRFVKKACMHCLEPACVSVCPVGALQKSATGAVIYDDTKCIGCRYCMTACPFDVPRYEWESAAPLIRKCQFCSDRLQQGQATACSGVCPSGALKFGTRSELLAEAAARIKAAPEKYVDYIYGKDEVGGTSVIYISNVPFEELGFRMDLPKEALPQKTQAVMSKIPALVLGLAVVLGTGTVLTGRNSANLASGHAAKTTVKGETK